MKSKTSKPFVINTSIPYPNNFNTLSQIKIIMHALLRFSKNKILKLLTKNL